MERKSRHKSDWLEKFFNPYERAARKVLKDRSKNFSARALLAWTSRLRHDVNVLDPNLKRIVYDVAWMLRGVYNLGIMKTQVAVLGSIKGGRADKRKKRNFACDDGDP
jgi:hypothetical protein